MKYFCEHGVIKAAKLIGWVSYFWDMKDEMMIRQKYFKL